MWILPPIKKRFFPHICLPLCAISPNICLTDVEKRDVLLFEDRECSNIEIPCTFWSTCLPDSNRFFTAQQIRDTLTLFTKEEPQYDNKEAYYKILDEMERTWTDKQKQILTVKIQY